MDVDNQIKNNENTNDFVILTSASLIELISLMDLSEFENLYFETQLLRGSEIILTLLTEEYLSTQSSMEDCAKFFTKWKNKGIRSK